MREYYFQASRLADFPDFSVFPNIRVPSDLPSNLKKSSKKGIKKFAKLKKGITFAPALGKFIKILEGVKKGLPGKRKVCIFAFRLLKKGEAKSKTRWFSGLKIN